MYLEHFGFSEKPFNVTPDLRFFYPNVSFIEAESRMAQGIHEGQGFVVLTGEVGIGKTTLLRRLINSTAEENVHGAYFYNTDMSFDELLVFVCEDFGIQVEDTSRGETVKALNQFLVERLDAGEKAVLFIDEAQNLAPEVLEGLRLLSNLETNTQKLLQIVLVGQPELDDLLDRAELRQVKQRIAVRAQLKCLSESELGDYINCRIQTAGCARTDLFTPEAIRWIAHYSQGLPRLVNRICDDSLLLASQFSQPRVPEELIRQVALDLRLETGQRKPTFELRKLLGEATANEHRQQERKRRLTRVASLAALAFASITVVTYLFHPEAFNQRFLQERDRLARLIEVLKAPAVSFDDSEVASATPNKRAQPENILAGAAVLKMDTDTGKNANLVADPTRTQGEAPAKRSDEASVIAKIDATEKVPGTLASADVPEEQPVTLSAESPALAIADPATTRPGQEDVPEVNALDVPGDVPDQKQVASATESTALVRTPEYVIVKKGESISQILGRAYGQWSDLALELARQFNPNVSNLNLIRAGEKFNLPVLDGNTLLQKHSDGSSTLTVGAFRSGQRAKSLALQWEKRDYKTRVRPSEAAKGLSLYRVEILELRTPQEIDKAWQLLQGQTVGRRSPTQAVQRGQAIPKTHTEARDGNLTESSGPGLTKKRLDRSASSLSDLANRSEKLGNGGQF